jgi:hypothetical protein
MWRSGQNTAHLVNLPGIEDARVWEPEPATVYFWSHNAPTATRKGCLMQIFDLEAQGLRALNKTLHAQAEDTNQTVWTIENARGSHAIACRFGRPY